MNDTGLTLLAQWLKGFDTKQAEAYRHEGNCAVLAGPGSGKTRVLTAKVMRLFGQSQNGPRGVACVTFNNEAVREIQSRLSAMGLKPNKRLFIGTVHSFCMACVIEPFGHLFRGDLGTGLAVAGRQEQSQALRRALERVGLSGRTTDWQTRLQRYRRTHPLRDSQQWDEDSELSKLVATYEELLHAQGLLDFDDMVIIALDLIRKHEFVRMALEARFPFLVVDEYQDLGHPLHLIVKLLMRQTGMEVFVVGDPDQSIYGFTGANPKDLRSLAEDPTVHQVALDMNYRSTQRIIDASQVALAPEKARNYRSAREGMAGEISFLECPEGLDQQAEVVSNDIIPDLKQRGFLSDQIAILYIDKWDQLVLSETLDRAGVKYAGERDQRYPRTPFTRWLEEVAVWLSLFPETQRAPDFGDLFYRYVQMKEEAGISVNPADLIERVGFFEAITASAATNATSLAEWLKSLDSLLDLRGCLSARKAHPEDLADWDAIWRSCQGGEALAGLDLDDFAGFGGRPDTVTLTTLHSSKGREYRAIIIPGLEEGRLPRYGATSIDALAEARRLFYVGMTRAEDAIYLLYSGWYRDGYNRVWRKGPSRFVDEVRARMSG